MHGRQAGKRRRRSEEKLVGLIGEPNYSDEDLGVATFIDHLTR